MHHANRPTLASAPAYGLQCARPAPTAMCRRGIDSLRARAPSERSVAIMKRALVVLLIAIAGCAPRDHNPLIAATDDQFIKAIGNLAFLGCEGPLFGADAGPGSDARRKPCEQGLQKRAADAGIREAVTSADIADPRVKARYARLFKR